ncbi:MAG TPA: hypothetical protein VMV22_02080 [Acidimicrobiales bacterium]|nr:hypothetical protein [Acidimicrobiales bacterium]
MFSDGNHYLVEESDGVAGNYDATPSEAVVGAQLTNGGGALAVGTDPYAVNWTIHDTGTTSVFVDAVSSVATLPGVNVICTSTTQSDSNQSSNCTPGSFDLDTAAHFANPANPALNGLGTLNNTMPANKTAIGAGASLSFTVYMTGGNNNAEVVVDSTSNALSAATVTAQVATDPFGSAIEGSTIGTASSASLQWLPVASASSVAGTLSAHDSVESAEPDATHDWVVLTGVSTAVLANFDQTTGQTYSASGAGVSEATFESDIAGGSFPTFSAGGYGSPGQANALVSSSPPSPPSPPPPSPSSPQHYWTVASDGGIFAFGAPFHGSTGAMTLNKPIVGMAATADGGGYWLVAADGGIFSFGDAAFHGSTGAINLNKPVVGMAATADGGGYWLVASDGGVFSFGDAAFHGSTGAMTLNEPIVGMAATADGGGYWLVAADGGIFSFGDAVFHGSTGAIHLNKPVVGMAVTSDGSGYWLVASDGGIFAFGAPFSGSTGAMHLNAPIVGMAADPVTGGYWLVASDGGIFAFGAPFTGSMGGLSLARPMVGMAESPT